MKVRRVISLLALMTGVIIFNLSLNIFTAVAAQSKARNNYDIVIAGAAIQAARMGVSVLLVEPTNWIGGQATAAGVSSMDDMSRIKSGIYLEFINRVKNYYDMRGKSMGTCYWDSRTLAFEPHVGQNVLLNLISDAKRKGVLDISYNSSVIAVQKDKNKITGVKIKTPVKF